MRDPATNRGAVQVAYGTARLDINRCGHVDFILQNNERMGELELPHATRFNLDPDRCNWLPWCSDFFCAPAHSAYIVAGVLNKDEVAILRARLKRRGVVTEL